MSSTPPEPRVLITGAGGPAAISLLRSLAPRTELYAVDIDVFAAGLYLVIDGHRAIVPRGDDPNFVDALLDCCNAWRIDVVVPTVDRELIPIAESVDRFEATGSAVVVAPPEPLGVCLDKWQLSRSISSPTGPVTRLLDEHFEASSFPFCPAVVKPRSGSGSVGVRVVDSLSAFDGVPRDGSHIVQEYLPGEELSVDVYVAADHRPIGAVPRQRLKVDSGVAVAGRTIHDAAAIDLALDVVAAVGLTGPANVQLRRDATGDLRLLEINPRFPGSLPLTIRAGFDIPGIALDEALGVIPTPLTSFTEVAVVRHLEEVFAEAEIFDRGRIGQVRRAPVT